MKVEQDRSVRINITLQPSDLVDLTSKKTLAVSVNISDLRDLYSDPEFCFSLSLEDQKE